MRSGLLSVFGEWVTRECFGGVGEGVFWGSGLLSVFGEWVKEWVRVSIL